MSAAIDSSSPAWIRAARATWAALALVAGAATAQDERQELPRLVVPWLVGGGPADPPTALAVALPHLMIRALLEVPDVVVVGQSAVRYAAARGGDEFAASAGLDRAARVGRIAEAAWVVWGSCRVDGEMRVATVRIVDVADGSTSDELRVEAGTWQGVRERLFDAIVGVLDFELDDETRARALRPLTRSDQCLEHFGRAIIAADLADDPKTALAELRAALDADPACAEAFAFSSQVLAATGQLDEAAKMVDQARRLMPGDPIAEVATANILATNGNLIAARIRLERARDAAPRWGEPYLFLGHVHAARNEYAEAIAAYRQALSFAPFRADIHARLARALAVTGERELALASLEDARRIDADDQDFLHEATRTYTALGMVPEALEHAERFVRTARRLGIREDVAEQFERNAAEQRARLEMRTVQAVHPRRFSATQLDDELDARLTPDQRRRVVHPFASDAALDAWAEELAAGIDDPLEKSRRIFDELIARANDRAGAGARTALQVRDSWGDPSTGFNCQELAKLFLAMARAVGVDAYYVHLEHDYEGRVVYHDCAAVFADDAAVLVDPAYRWFGVPHREFTVLDDLQAIAHQLLQAGSELSSTDRVARCRAGTALHPDFAWSQVKLAWAWLDAEDYLPAERALDEAERLEPGRWDVALARGALAVQRGDLDNAERWLRDAYDDNPTNPGVNRARAHLFALRGALTAARDAYRVALRHEHDEAAADEIRRNLAQIAKALRDR